MLGQYESDSDSEAPAADAAAVRKEDEESEEESADDDEEVENDKSKKLPSAQNAFASMQEAELGFKQFAKGREEQRRVKAAADRQDRVPAASAATLREQVGQVKRPVPEDDTDNGGDGKGGGKGKAVGKNKDSVKDRTKLKRIKGQSGLDHNGKVWKPEAWMQMRNEFD
mmetsp:Transcript_43061/g.96941  ORF Transcript_43061/g.96941 Transcript_43061/m.96941 type:complete len:169 (-) Transcript_43061:187-693(-)